jgi:hypothetical protein
MTDYQHPGTAFHGGRTAGRSVLLLSAILFVVRSAPAIAVTFEKETATRHRPTAEVTTYQAPAGVTASPDYRVQAAGHEVFVYGTPAFSLAAFAFSGEAEVAVTVQSPVRKVVIRPTQFSHQQSSGAQL